MELFSKFWMVATLGWVGCGPNQGVQSQVKVTNSDAVEETDYPAVRRLGQNCTATLIGHSMAITSATCAEKETVLYYEGKEYLPKLRFKHPAFRANEPLNAFNVGILVFDRLLAKDRLIVTEQRSLDKPFDFVGYGCADLENPTLSGIKRRSFNTFSSQDHQSSPLLVVKGQGLNTMHTKASAHGLAVGCPKGDGGAPAILNQQKILGLWVATDRIPGSRILSNSYFVDLSRKENADFINKVRREPYAPSVAAE